MFGAGGGKDSGKRAKEAHATMMRVMQRRLMMQRQMSGDDKRVQVEEEEEEVDPIPAAFGRFWTLFIFFPSARLFQLFYSLF